LSDDKRCRICGDALEQTEMGDGCVWSCTTHGVRDWNFGGGAHWTPSQAQGAFARAPRGPEPGKP
jgi:hypothetical protein